jgi:mono/diheme cytochrome c family protein
MSAITIGASLLFSVGASGADAQQKASGTNAPSASDGVDIEALRKLKLGSNPGPENPELKFKLPPPPVLSPAEALKTFKLPPGFHIELAAAEPLVEAPVAISFDDQARMYVCEMRGYMHDIVGTGEDKPIGRIKRLTSSKLDGIYDRATLFVDKLVMPRAVMALGDGALVGEPPYLTYYRDTNNDGVADSREIVSSNFGVRGGQPETLCNTPTWMLDNWITCAGHPWRYRYQQGSFVTETTLSAGQWGLTQDDWGRAYFNYNTEPLRGHMIAPQFYLRNPSLTKRNGFNQKLIEDGMVWPSHPTPGTNRGYTERELRSDGTLQYATAACGPSVYRGDLFPPEFRGNMFVPEPAGNLVKRLILSETGGVVSAKNAYTGTEFLTSTDERFRPVSSCNGPDGALYIVDLARGVLQHRSFLTYYLAANIKSRKLEQPITLGRIYRVVPDGAKPGLLRLPPVPAAIAPFLAHPNGWVRDTAQRLLIERHDLSVTNTVKRLAAQGNLPQTRVNALWTLEGLGVLDPEFIGQRLQDTNPHVRIAAIRLADRTLVPDLLKLVTDEDAGVRLNLALRLTPEPGPEVEKAVIGLLQKGGSPLVADAVATGLRGREVDFLEVLLRQPAGGRASPDDDAILTTLAGCVMSDRRGAAVARLLDVAASQPANSARQLALLAGMAARATGRNTVPQRMLYLEAAPPSLAKLQASASGTAKTQVTAIDRRLAWPGKPGVPPPPKVTPLDEAQKAMFEKGRGIYVLTCASCHQTSGAGLDGLAPPLLDSEWVLEAPDRPIRVVLNGLSGPISVEGTMWRLEMPRSGLNPGLPRSCSSHWVAPPGKSDPNLPTWFFGQAGVKGLDQPGFVGAGVGACEEAVEGLLEQALPRSFFGTGIDREKQRAIGFGCLEIPGRVPDHQNLFRRVFAFGREFEVLSLGSHLLPGNKVNKRVDFVFRPFPLERLGRGLRNDHGVGLAHEFLQ